MSVLVNELLTRHFYVSIPDMPIVILNNVYQLLENQFIFTRVRARSQRKLNRNNKYLQLLLKCLKKEAMLIYI